MASIVNNRMWKDNTSTLGWDPEFHVTSNRGYVKDWPGKPHTRIRIESTTVENAPRARSWATADGAAFEIHCKPDYCLDYLVPYLQHNLSDWAKAVNEDGNIINIEPVVKVSKQDAQLMPPEALEFGCAPSIDGYRRQIVQPTMPDGFPFRFAGGHIHLLTRMLVAHSGGELESATADAFKLAASLDANMAVPLIAIWGHPHYRMVDKEKMRREFYGGPSEFRVPEKRRLEYRTLSSWMLMQHPTVMFWALRAARLLADFPKQNVMLCDRHEAARIISECDWEAAAKAVMSFNEKRETSWLRLPMLVLRAYEKGRFFSRSFYYNWAIDPNKPKFKAVHHNWWGDISATNGLLRPNIFPNDGTLKTSPDSWADPKTHPYRSMRKRRSWKHTRT